ncbi:hypothetical protein GTCCBUS3UF5_30460 [Geobacillus thermoleovorans CCB_US3_UF5]|uniref:Uncharacterized protein n=2 Tax=Geobacillus thermoleovorans group TaxID=1505648 RepID=U2WMJ1_GEOKU|nr:hypothetical protein GTCCBUS3UF5_30460 [Geobacillus thermoleovorans CCB_US3_UF5]GAD11986.1 hypothetical protein GBL_0203 [Geobacillus kaustophilus GBlys]GAJ57902.1 hypothetical protein B23_1108 [Geobacillus thermoleovorans B23]
MPFEALRFVAFPKHWIDCQDVMEASLGSRKNGQAAFPLRRW